MPDAEAPLWSIASRLNWLRAGVLGANDGIVSTAAMIFGVAGAAAAHQTVMLAGIAAVVAGALSMAVGEYVSVSTQRDLASRAAVELTENDALAAHARVELGIDPNALTNPWAAAFASMVAFTVGGLIPLIAMLLAPQAIAVFVAGAAVLVALALSGMISAGLGGAPRPRAIARTVGGGLLAMAITYGIGKIVGMWV